MKKLFVSLPMAGLTTEEIKNKIIKYKENAEQLIGEKLELINTIITEAPDDIKDKNIWCLGKSIMMMANADIVYFGHGWNQARGCRAEYEVACGYKLLRIGDTPCWDRLI